MSFGNNLSKIRKSVGMSQEQLAEKLNISRQAISKWESDQSLPDINVVAELCKIFNVSADDLILGNASKKRISSDKSWIDLPYIISSVFTIIGFILGIIIIMFAFFYPAKEYNAYDTPFALILSGSSVIIFVIITIIKVISSRRKK